MVSVSFLGAVLEGNMDGFDDLVCVMIVVVDSSGRWKQGLVIKIEKYTVSPFPSFDSVGVTSWIGVSYCTLIVVSYGSGT